MPGSRRHTSLKLGQQPRTASPRLSCGFTPSAGRGLGGSRTILAKGARQARQVFKPLFTRYDKAYTLAVVVSLQSTGPRSTLSFLARTADGAWYQAPLCRDLLPLSYIQAVPHTDEAAYSRLTLAWWWRPLASLPPHTKISLVAANLGDNPRYARSPGSTCLLLTPVV